MEKGWLKSYFQFSKKERNAFVIFSAIILLLLFFPFLFKYYNANKNGELQNSITSDVTDSNEISEAVIYSKEERSANKKYTSAYNATLSPTFFNPNTVSPQQLLSFGLREKLVNTIVNYRTKGGFFRNASDIAKIYGIKEAEVQALMPFIKIAESEVKNNPSSNFYSKAANTPKIITPIDINTATAEQWQALPGIGEKLATRVINYRGSRKGFKTIDEVANTYGISAETFNLIKPYLVLNNTLAETTTISNTEINKLVNINKASENTLSKVPGITNDIAKAIIIYRSKYGPFAQVAELKKIVFISDDLLQIIQPHVTVN